MPTLRARFESRKRTSWTLFRNFLIAFAALALVYIIGNIVRVTG